MTNEELAERIQRGEKELMLELWLQVHKLVIQIVRKYLPLDGSTNQIEWDDLIQAGFLAVMDAVDDFTPMAGFSFTTYLSRHVANAANEAMAGAVKNKSGIPYIMQFRWNRPLVLGLTI